MHQSAVIHIYDIVEALLLMKSEGKRTILDTVAEAVLHLISVAKYKRALYNALIAVLIAIRRDSLVKQSMYVITLNLALFLFSNVITD